MKKIYLLLASIFLLTGTTKAQTIFSDDFSGGDGNWTLGVAGNGDTWIVNNVYICATNTPDKGGGNYLHISNGTNLCAYGDGGFTSTSCSADMKTGVSTVGYSSVSIVFSWLCNGAGLGFYKRGTVSFSVDSGKTWTLTTQPRTYYNGQGSWASSTITSANYPALLGKDDVRIRFGWETTGAALDPAFAVDDVVISGVGGIACGNVGGTTSASPDTVCLGQSSDITLTGATGTRVWEQSPTGNSDWTEIQNVFSDTYTTDGLTSTTYYRVVLTETGCPDQVSTVSSVAVNSGITPVVVITVSPNDTICEGQSISFTAEVTDGGSNPTYQWQLNGEADGPGDPTYSPPNIFDGFFVSLTLYNNESACANPGNSNIIVVTVLPPAEASVTIASEPSGILCSGNVVTFTASAQNGGDAPSFQWQVNGSDVGGDSATYSTNALSDADTVTVILTSNALCVSGSPAEASDTVEVAICTGIASVEAGKDFTISPNPSGGLFSVLSDDNISCVQIFDLQGKMLQQQNFIPTIKQKAVIVDITSRAAGVYFMRVVSKQGIVNTKLVVE